MLFAAFAVLMRQDGPEIFGNNGRIGLIQSELGRGMTGKSRIWEIQVALSKKNRRDYLSNVPIIRYLENFVYNSVF